MARLHIGTATTLAAEPQANCSNGDIARIWLNGCNVNMVYDSTATNATDIADPPTTVYYIRPDDYGAAGVWIENVGAEEAQRFSMDQIRTGELVIDDDGSIHTSGKTSYADTDAGFWFGYDTDKHKMNFGNANSYIKWDGAAMAQRMAFGEAFDLYGSLNIYGGGDLTLAANGDIILNTETGSADSNRAMIQWNLKTYNVKLAGDFDADAMIFAPSTDAAVDFYIGEDWGLGGSHRFDIIRIKGTSETSLTIYQAGTLYGGYIGLDKGTSDRFTCSLIAQAGATYKAGFDGYVDESDTEAYITMYGDLIVQDNKWIGLGAAKGRIEFDDQATDEINFLDCNVGINDSTPNYRLDVNGTGRFVGAVTLDSTLAVTGVVTLSSTLELGGNLDLNEKAILYDFSSLASDHTCSGDIISGTAGENLVIGDVCFLKADSKFWHMDADSQILTKGLCVMATGTINAEASGTFLLRGLIRDDTWDWGVGDPLFVSTTPGNPTNTKPSGSNDVVRTIGHGVGADYIWFNPDNSYEVIP